MKDLFKNKTKKEINELLTKTDVPQTWFNDLKTDCRDKEKTKGNK